MKALTLVAVVLAVGSVGLAWRAHTLAARLEAVVSRTCEGEPKALILRILQHPDAYEFVRTNHKDLASNVEVVNFLESDGVGLAFVRSRAASRDLQWCQWMHKVDSGWEWLNPITEYSTDSPFVGDWVRRNLEWTKEMSKKAQEWERASDGFW